MPSIGANRGPFVNPGVIAEDYIHVVAGILWRNDNRSGDQPRFLIAQRQQGKHLQGHWEFPGGKVESGELPWQALQRELEEEISIEATAGSPFMRVYYRYPERNVMLDTWLVTEYRGAVLANETQELQWISIAEADAFQWPQADIPILEAIKSNATTETRRFP